MNALVMLAIILFLLMLIIGGRKGAKSFIALFLNFIILLLTTVFMTDPHVNPILLTLIACILISAINLFFINEVNSKTTIAFVAAVITIVIMLFLIHLVTTQVMIQGFSEEQIEELSVFSLYIGVDFVKIGTAVVIMSTIGAITDVAISITSPMMEVYQHHPDIKRKDLFASGLRIGRSILGSDTNTLFFAFFGSYLALLLWFKDVPYSFGEVINSKIFAREVIIILFAGIGIALIIPIAAWINAFYLTRSRKKI